MYFYIGDGSLSWPGVPLRDLSREEWDVLPPAVQSGLLKSGLFSKRRPAGRTVDSAPAEPEPLAKTDDLSAPQPAQGSEAG